MVTDLVSNTLNFSLLNTLRFIGITFVTLPHLLFASNTKIKDKHHAKPVPPFKLIESFRDNVKDAQQFIAGDHSSLNAYGGGDVYHWQYPKGGIDDPEIGRYNPPASQVRQIRKYKGKIIYDVIYTYDPMGRRYTWNQPLD